MMVHTPSSLASPRCLSACLPVCLSWLASAQPQSRSHYGIKCITFAPCHVGTRPTTVMLAQDQSLSLVRPTVIWALDMLPRWHQTNESVCLALCLSVCLSVYLSVCISVSLSVSLSSCFAVRITARNHCAETRVCGNRGTSQMSSSTATCLVLSVCVSTVSVPGEGSVWLCLSTLASCAQPASWCPAPVSGLRGHRM